MAAFLIGEKGTLRQALTIGLTVTATHTVGVLALGVLLSLLFGSFNLSAFVMEAAWLLISVYGIMVGRRTPNV